MDVFFYEAFQEEAECIKKYLHPRINAGYTGKTIQELVGTGPPASLISIRTQSVIPETWTAALAGILTRSTGYDHIETYLRSDNNRPPCGYLPPYCSRAVAEHAMLLWTALLRNLPGQIQNFSLFNRNGLTGRECSRKNLLVVGVGNIGIEVVRIGEGLGMHVQGVDIVQRQTSVTYVTIEQGIVTADVIVCAMNLTADNAGYFNYQLLKKVRPGAVFVNVSRGELAPEDVLLRLLEENRLSGVGLDVFNNEVLVANTLRSGQGYDNQAMRNIQALAGRRDAILTPHNAFNTSEAIDKKAQFSVEQIESFLKHGVFSRPVPIPLDVI